MKTRPFLWGKLVWNMFDFASDKRTDGDGPGRNDKGLVTYDRKTRKDAFFWYKANWRDWSQPDGRVVYITSRRYTNRTSPITSIKVYSNADSVELKLNGVSLGCQTGSDRMFLWRSVALTSGNNTVEAIGTRNGIAVSDSVTWTSSSGSRARDDARNSPSTSSIAATTERDPGHRPPTGSQPSTPR
jgi:beta-galactosidase